MVAMVGAAAAEGGAAEVEAEQHPVAVEAAVEAVVVRLIQFAQGLAAVVVAAAQVVEEARAVPEESAVKAQKVGAVVVACRSLRSGALIAQDHWQPLARLGPANQLALMELLGVTERLVAPVALEPLAADAVEIWAAMAGMAATVAKAGGEA